MSVAHPSSAPTTRPGSEGRLTSLDHLKVLLVAAIIAIHAVLGYASIVEVWTYTEMREVTLAPVTEVVLFVVAAPFGLFLIALLFLVAGLLTPGSLDRKGPARFVRDRLLRLGVPFVVYAFGLQPVLTYALEHPLGDAPGSFTEEYLGAERRLDTGPLWFVGVLLVFSLGAAGVRAVSGAWTRRRRVGQHRAGRRVGIALLALVAAVVAPLSFAVRLVHPYGSESGVSDLNLWEWPACAAVFAVGAAAAREGWLVHVPDTVARRARDLTVLGGLALALLLGTVAWRGGVDDVLGGWSWGSLAFSAADAVLTVFGSVWLLAVAQRRLTRPWRWGPALARSAYGAFVLQTVFLLGVAVALRPVGLPAEVKAVLVAAASLVGSFGLAWLLVERVPGVRRIL